MLKEVCNRPFEEVQHINCKTSSTLMDVDQKVIIRRWFKQGKSKALQKFSWRLEVEGLFYLTHKRLGITFAIEIVSRFMAKH